MNSSGARQASIWAVAAAAVVARLPLLGHAPGSDEAGFLMVGHQWTSAGSSLYTNYWVDRPPLLVSIFRLASLTGGLVSLRVIGCVAVALLVIGSAAVAGRIGGDRAARWAALTAAALTVTPVLGGTEVNGELLSAPFVVAGLWAALRAVAVVRRSQALIAAAGAGAAFAGAMLIKQNIADVGVFAAVLLVLSLRRREVNARRVLDCVVGFVAGALVLVAATAAWTVLHGTSLAGVFTAMYPFRLQAAHVLASSTGSAAPARLWVMLGSWLLSGGAVIMAVTAWALASRRLRGSAVWALMATVAFDAASVALGGNYWTHYLIQAVGPIAITAGVLVERRQWGMRPLLTWAAAVAVLLWGVAMPVYGTSVGASVGHSVRSAAMPTDTIVTAYGHAEVTQTSGLTSPYPFLWSLPAKTLDPDLATLDAVLSGPQAPTWFVTWNQVPSWGLDTTHTEALIARDYHLVAVICGRTVYLHNGVQRPAPIAPSTCSTATHSTLVKEILS